jgi:hypothetical protein
MKVTLCEQGRATENRILQSDRTIFIALETILFTAVFTKLWDNVWGGVVAIVGIVLTFLWWHICDLRGDAVDRWEEALARLWQKANKSGLSPLNPSELYKHYRGAIERRKRRREGERTGGRIGARIGGRIGKKIGRKIGGRIAVSIGWGWGRLKSARWVFTTPIPLIVFGLWIWVMSVSFFDC